MINQYATFFTSVIVRSSVFNKGHLVPIPETLGLILRALKPNLGTLRSNLKPLRSQIWCSWGKMENDLLFCVYYLLLPESTPPSTTRLKLLYSKGVQVFLDLLVYHAGSPRSTLAPLTKCTRLYSKVELLLPNLMLFS